MTRPCDPRRLEPDRVETPQSVVRLNDVGSVPRRRAPTVDSLSDPERAVARAALDDGYEFDGGDLPDWLVTFVVETPYLRRDGTYYRLKHDFPRYTITAEETTEAAVEGPVADSETYEEAVTDDGRRRTGLIQQAREGGATRLSLPPSLREFLRTYAAVRTGDLLSVSLTTDDDGPPYEVTAERVAPTDLVDEPVYDATDATEGVREAVRAAGGSDGIYAGTVPEELLDAVGNHRYVYLDGTFYWARVENRGELPVAVEAAVTRPLVSEREEARLRLVLHNRGDREVSVFSGAPPPFGVLYLEAVDGQRRSLLWTDAYRESSHVETDGRSVGSVREVGQLTPLPAGERLGRVFTVTDRLEVGEYVLRGDVGIETADGDELGTRAYRVYFRVVEGSCRSDDSGDR